MISKMKSEILDLEREVKGTLGAAMFTSPSMKTVDVDIDAPRSSSSAGLRTDCPIPSANPIITATTNQVTL